MSTQPTVHIAKPDVSPYEFLSLVCARYAYVVRRATTRLLLDHIIQRNPTDPASVLGLLEPSRFVESINDTVKRDSASLLKCWRALNASQQNAEYQRWHALEPNICGRGIHGTVENVCEQTFYSRKLREIAENVLRFGTAVDNMEHFWGALSTWQDHPKDAGAQAQLYDTWADLFSIIVWPVEPAQRDAHVLHALCVPGQYKRVNNLIASTDEEAYGAFAGYVSDEMQTVWTGDYREDVHGGIRSLHCYYFNDLSSLSSCGDNPAALVIGCRSGVQYQIRSYVEPRQIIGVVAMYIPVYDFFARMFGLRQAGLLIDSDGEYAELWSRGNVRGGRDDRKKVASLLIAPFRADQQNGCHAIVRQLSRLTASWRTIEARVGTHSLDTVASEAIRVLKTEGFSATRAAQLEAWVEGVTGAPARTGGTLANVVGEGTGRTQREGRAARVKATTGAQSAASNRERGERCTVEELRGTVDVAVITVRQDEYNAIASRLGVARPVTGGNNSYEFVECGTRSGSSTRVVLTRLVRQGNTESQAVANNTIQDLDPAWLFLVGIAGGTPDDDYSLGDVVIATQLNEFSLSAAIEGKGIAYQVSGGRMHPSVDRFVQTGIVGARGAALKRLAGFHGHALQQHPPMPRSHMALSEMCYGSEKWRDDVAAKIDARFPRGRRDGAPRIHAGACANGNMLMKDTKTLSDWKRVVRQVTHVEMELEGVYAAARSAGKQNYPVLAIRGLSDIVGFKRDGRWTSYACQVAAGVAVAVLRSGLIEWRAER